MPTINVNKIDLEKLTNMSLSDKTIEDKFPMMGVEVEGIFEENNQKIVQFSINPDRPDYLSVEGLARGFRGFIGIDMGLPKYDIRTSDLEVYVENVQSRPYCGFAIIKNIIIDDLVLESIINLQEKLHWSIGRDRKKMAIGIHDLDKIEAPFYYKEINGDEIEFEPLGHTELMTPKEVLEKHEKGVKYAHLLSGDKFPIIVDKNNTVISMPPIINGNLTKVGTETRNLLVEITGTDKNAVENTLNIIVCALADRRGTIFSLKLINNGKETILPDLTPNNAEITIDEINTRLGLNLNAGEIIACLKKARYDAQYSYEDENLKITIPTYRTDILNNVDIIKDVAINYGYENFKGELPAVATIGEKHIVEKKFEFIRNAMIGFGLFEVMNLTLSNQEVLFNKMNINIGDNEYVEVLKPASIEHRVVRPTILPLLLETLANNKHNELPQKIFEVGDCVVIDEKDETLYTHCKNVPKVSAVITHHNANFNEIKGLVEGLLREINMDYSIDNYKHPSFIDGRCAKIIVDNEIVGYFGELHPEIILNFELGYPVVGFEMEIK